MTDLFDDGGADESAFVLPGDEARLAAMQEPALTLVPEPAAAPAAPAEPAAEPPATDPAAAAPDEPTEFGEVARAEALADPRVQEYLAKYGGDVEKALAAAADAQSVIGRQGRELGELRDLVESRVGSLEETVRQAAQPQYDQDELAAYFTENPTRIPDVARNAFYQGNEALMEAALDAWEEIDRVGARRFGREVSAARVRQELQAEAAQSQVAATGWSEAAAEFAAEHPDLEAHAGRMREIAPAYPNLVSILQTGSAEARLEVLDFLYEKARGQVTDTLATRTRQIARDQAQEAAQVIKEAAVASGTTAVTAPATTVAERIGAAWDTADAPYNDGWKV